MSDKINWQALEKLVRLVAEVKFSAVARAEDIAGVKCDCVLYISDGSAAIVEISKERTISKLRTDLAKFSTIRPHFFARNVFPKCFFITKDSPTPALIEAGKAQYVDVYSCEQFLNSMLGLGNYASLRSAKPFGSAIDLYSGEPDTGKYVEVNYFSDSGEPFSAEKISSLLVSGKTVVLVGDYGSGKSRCVKEVFSNLIRTHQDHYKTPIAINLRDNWGLKRSSEIITRHFTDIGLGNYVHDIVKISFSPATVYLLDGFDEIGAQTWSDDPTKLVDIRRKSLVGVKDLIAQSRSGVLITGRDHYFNNDEELITCLGLGTKPVVFLRCNQELSVQQFSELIGRRSDTLPQWIPRKPLIGTVIRDIDSDAIDHIFGTSTGQVDFWDLLITTFCVREANINPILDPNIIRSLYASIGRISRTTETSLGPISIKLINEAFEKVTGRPPTDESAIILQRLPGLSRIGAESLDRQFVDSYILDGLKAEDVFSAYSEDDRDLLQIEWKHPVESFGSLYLATRINNVSQTHGVAAYIKRNFNAKNKVMISDLLSALFLCATADIDFSGQKLSGGKFFHLSFGESKVSGVTFDDCSFNSVDLTDADPERVLIANSTILRVSGIASSESAPAWVSNCLFEDFQNMNTLVAIREAGLTVAQTFLLSSLRKLFFQPGAGRQESAMYKGYGDSITKKTCEKVIAILIRDKICQKFKGAAGNLYIPDRSLTGRIRAIMSQMTQSKDPVWLQVSKLR